MKRIPQICHFMERRHSRALAVLLSPHQAVAPFPGRKGASVLTQKKPIRWRLLSALASPQLLKVTVLLLCAKQSSGELIHGQPLLIHQLQHLGEVTPRSHDLEAVKMMKLHMLSHSTIRRGSNELQRYRGGN